MVFPYSQDRWIETVISRQRVEEKDIFLPNLFLIVAASINRILNIGYKSKWSSDFTPEYENYQKW